MNKEIVLQESVLYRRRQKCPLVAGDKPDLMRILVDLIGIDPPGQGLEITLLLQQAGKIDGVLDRKSVV